MHRTMVAQGEAGCETRRYCTRGYKKRVISLELSETFHTCVPHVITCVPHVLGLVPLVTRSWIVARTAPPRGQTAGRDTITYNKEDRKNLIGDAHAETATAAPKSVSQLKLPDQNVCTRC